MMRRRSSTEVQGRPGVRQGWVQWRAIRCRCQRSRVSGVTSQPARRRRGSAAAIAPSRARSSSARAGWLFSRCRTVSWWRNTMISRSFERPERTAKPANDTRNRYRMRHMGSQDASSSCLVSAYDRILGTYTLTQSFRVSLLGLPGLPARGLRSGSMLDADSTRFVALCLLSDVSRRVLGRQERSCLEGSLTVSTRL